MELVRGKTKKTWEAVKDVLLAEIRRGALRPGARVPSERDLAVKLSVSHPTVHKALSSLATEGLVVRQVGRGTFVTEAAGRRTGAIAMYFGKWANPFEDPILYRVCAGVAAGCSERGLDLFFHTPADIRFFSPSEYVRSILERGCDGVLCVGDVRGEVVEEIVEQLQAVLVADHRLKGLAPVLVADHGAAVALGVAHLASLGRRRIALAGMIDAGYALDEAIVDGYRSALARAGLEYDESLVSMTNPAVPDRFRFAAQPGSQYWFDARALRGSPRADAVVAANPGMARSVYEYAIAEGLGIGSDIAVVCVMETRWTEHARPGCTAVDFLSPGLGRQGVAMLMEAIDHKIGPETVRVGEIPIVVRESCGAPAGMRSAARQDLAEVAG